MKNGSVTGADVGRRAGNSTVGFGLVTAHKCKTVPVDVDPGNADMRDDAITATPDSTYPNDVSFSTESSDSLGFIWFTACNPTAANIAVGNQLVHWVAFDS